MPDALTRDQFFSGADPGQPQGAVGGLTRDQFFSGATAPPPTAPQSGIGAVVSKAFGGAVASLFNTPLFGKTPVLSGAAHDVVFGSSLTPQGRTLNAAGYGAQQAWGSEPWDLDDKTKADLTKAGVFNDYSKGRTDFFKTQNEAVMRGATQAFQLVTRGIPALFGGAEAGLQQAQIEAEGGQDTGTAPSLTRPFAAASELLQEVQGGALMETFGAPHGFTAADIPAVRARVADQLAAARADATTAARASAVVGEGEAGFYEAKPVTPENAAARATAAQEADITPSAPIPPALDIHVLARRIDPETFEQFDALAVERDLHRQTIADLGAEREKSPEAAEARAQIDTILGKVNNVPERLTKAAAQRLADAQARLDDILTRDTPQMAEARAKLMDADFAMRDLAPQVSDAYRQARDMAPELPEPDFRFGEPQLPGEQPTEELGAPGPPGAPGATQRIVPAAAAAASDVAPFEPPSVTGEQKLGATGGGSGAEQTAASTQEGVQPSTGAEGVKTGQARYGNLRAVEGTGELRTRGLAENVEAKAIEDGLTSGFSDLPEYRQISMADQAAQAVRLMDEDYETAKAIAMGDKQPPKGLLPESVYVAVERRALVEGDVDTIQQLATRSRLATSATTMGQRIRTLGERDKASPVGMIQEIQAAREADLAKRSGDIKAAKKAAVDEIKTEIRKAASKPDAWASFIDSIRCS